MNVRLVAAAVGLALACVVGLTSRPSDAAPPPFAVGLTHTESDADPWHDPASVSRAQRVLRSTVRVQVQALMGWGAGNPEPSPGDYDWSSLDRRLTLVERTGGTPVVTLCCAPDWMKGGVPGITDWSRLEAAPLRSQYASFAALAVELARRHPEIRTFLVWNELKGFWNHRANTWDAAGYTDLYNTVYDALKAYDPALKIGGPYVPVDLGSDRRTMSNPSSLSGPWGVVDQRSLDVLRYWLAHAHGADMVVVDGGTGTKDKGLVTDDLRATGYFTAVTSWLRSRTSLPVWWSEFGVAVKAGSTPQHGVRVMAAALAAMRRGGARMSFLWHVEGASRSCVTCLWTDTSKVNGGLEAPLAAVVRRANGR